MVSVLLDVRQARQRRLTLLALAAAALVLPFAAWLLPTVAAWLAPPTLASVLLAGAAMLAASVCVAWSGREAHWSLADDIAWSLLLVSLAGLGASARAPFAVAAMLHGVALVLLGVRVPPPRMVLVGASSVLLGLLWRAAVNAPFAAYALAMGLATMAHIFMARATHALAWVLSERETLLNERRALARAKPEAKESERTTDPVTAAVSLSRAMRAVTTSAAKDDDKERDNAEPGSWEALIERIRATLTARGAAAGVVVTVDAEVRGLVAPAHRLRQQVLKIAQEAADHAIRDTSPSSITVSMRRGEGGLVLEVHDDGPEGETLRTRRVLASVRGRVAPLGGSAEVRRADVGWVVRVKLPCEQLN
ncbi:MAG: hypothetical protein R3A52_09430 [Polyangiales bacterium]